MEQSQLLQFFVANNLATPNLVEKKPWHFGPAPALLARLRSLPKDQRRRALLVPATQWNVYTAFRGLAPNLRISKDNPPVAMRGIVVDYDSKQDVATVKSFIRQLPEAIQPNFIEQSLGGKIRLIWIFEREILLPSQAFATDLVKAFHRHIGIPTLLAGYDPASEKPSEMWTNGGDWYAFKETPLTWKYCFGVLSEVSKKASLFANGELSLDVIAEEVQKRFPGRWSGDFKLDALGVRFWDPKADNPTGCQVKPDGMLCFTGNEPFMKWEAIFGRQWVEEKRVLNLGSAAAEIYFDGRNYWENLASRWSSTQRCDIILRLKGRGISDKAIKGATQTDVERVLNHIQLVNKIDGAASLINYAPGLVDLHSRRILNTSDLRVLQPVAGPRGDPEHDFPWLWKFLQGFLAHADKGLDHLLAWLQRFYRSLLMHEKRVGQALFICGPKGNGKTLFTNRVVGGLMGGRIANPINYFTGQTIFNSELFEAPLWAVNDEEQPGSENARLRMLAKVKGSVVNVIQTHLAKFNSPVLVDWVGRIMMTLNDDPWSVGLLPEVDFNSSDKMMFFKSQPYTGNWPSMEEVEATVARELPFMAYWLLNVYKAPQEIMTDPRMGVASFYDPDVLALSNQQTYGQNLVELLEAWMEVDSYWAPDNKNDCFEGTPTKILGALQQCAPIADVASRWTQQATAKSLTSLAKQEGSCVEFAGQSGRVFRVKKCTSPE